MRELTTKRLFMLVLLIAGLVSCKKEGNQSALESSLTINVYQSDHLIGTDGQQHRVNASIVVWDESVSHNIKVNNYIDAVQGIAHDSITHEVLNYKYYGSNANLNVQNIESGKYFVYIVDLYEQNVGNPLYSYKHFEIKKGENLELDKIFIYPGTNTYQIWQ